MDLAQVLVRQVVRAFYPTPEILVVEALVMHSCLRDDDLAYLMKMNSKDLHKLCAGLAAQRFLVVAARQEQVENKTRPISRTYYYIDYRQAVDAIKWRWFRSSTDMQSTATAATETKDYFCPRCKAEWSQYDVLDKWSAGGFLCHRCESVLTKVAERASPGHQQSARMNNQFKFMTDALQQIDDAGVPECTFDKALANMRPIERAATHEAVSSVPVDMTTKPTAVKGLANTGPKIMTVTITDGNEEQEAAAEARRRKEQLLANALPSWITDSSVPTNAGANSTIVGQTRKFDFGEDASPAKKVKLEVKVEEEEEDDEIEFEDVV
ncbi:hypothetical protein P8C59_007929 [Phyllachora maydis]|uniref:HTH TFE/IIEalpha-type domain-containing protein n=1 Tax=Phyllachora maydis TaxID=1825666 RepID=A0AAD9MJ21_9PEZI|nr:hypothetical protein P8C59_007929 [Phyllachora maydis]